MNAAGFAAYGKIPALGDFLRINAPQSFVTPWDAWLQSALVAAKQACGDRWQECYFSAPIWRFTLAPGLAGPDGVLGVMMPSVDRVGREFPLTLFAAAGPDPVAAHHANALTFANLEDIALNALSDDTSRDGLAVALAQIAAPQTGGNPQQARRSMWSALTPDGSRSVAFTGLPDPANCTGFFDLTAADWPDVQPQDLTV
ncbi:type VI secretion system-associated protein TagF [Loktanella salsilacus]|uniref:type VI secretion system-associated protein TagF n=1 Tax=Loktanella salsilacus TaxID=195913 RepID=UPI0020B86560|nr:type VI secretion system-associated protein TagF [Loktanella salsilacus]UTH47130.1 type VI secretion system-associated protein TagF [Loktanella salsilacus]